MNSYIARQPIFNKNLNMFAYELLFRAGEQDSEFSNANADQASSRVVMESFHTMGLASITAGKPAFINFTSTLLLEKVATLFPKELLVIELLEDIEPTPEIIEVCRYLHKSGYTLALDDFVYRPELEPLIELAQIIKFDFLLSSPWEIKEMLRRIDTRGKRLLAEKIETTDALFQARAMGFTLFQGYIFSKPVTLKAREIMPLKSSYISLLKEERAGHNMDFDILADIIQRDVALSYKLLRMVNSAYYGLHAKKTDIKQSLAVLGTTEIRKWIYLMAMIGMETNRPDEFIRISMIRAQFMELIRPNCRESFSSENLFLTGLFSLIDVLLDQPMSSALASLPIDDEVYDALANQSGSIYTLLNLVICLERGEWENVDDLADSLGLNMSQVSDAYLEAVKWCNKLYI